MMAHLKTATRISLYAALLVAALSVSIIAMILSVMETTIQENSNEASLTMFRHLKDIMLQQWSFWFSLVLILLLGCLAIFIINTAIVDHILNPVRLMSDKVKSIGNKNFDERLVIDSAEDELLDFAAVFNEMAQKLHNYDKKQKQFISDASHELVTPITVINGHADLLLRWGKDDPALLTETLSVIQTEALAMNSLVENLLFFARSDNKTLPYQFAPCHLSILLEECIAELRLLAPDFTIHCACPAEIILPADTDAMKRVFRILFANSVKYSPHEKEITITVKNDHSLSITISDKGIGIPDAFLRSVFDRFYRVDDSRTKASGGTGLGLAIAAEIVAAHSGCIYALSNPAGATIQMDFFMQSS